MTRWAVKNRLDKLKFARQKLAHSYFSAAATVFQPELSDARMTWAKHSMLAILVDDFYDMGASQEEMDNLTQLVEKYVSIVSHLFLVPKLIFLFIYLCMYVYVCQ